MRILLMRKPSDLEILNDVIDSIERQPDRVRKIATLRCFVRGLHGQEVLTTDQVLLDLPKDVMVLPVGEFGEA